MSVPTISALPTAPQVTDTPTVFSDRANTFVAALSTLVSETNTTVGAINDALAGALVTFNAYQGDWSAGSYASGDVVRNDGIFYISLTGSNTQEPPDTNWQALGDALSTTYDNSTSGLTATNVKDALDEVVSDISGIETIPAGAVMHFARNTAPTGWLKADGSAVSRSTYAALFSAIGTTFGTGDGSTTFNLPDLRGEFMRGWDDGRGVDSGRSFGSAQSDEFKSHSHGVSPTYYPNAGIQRVFAEVGGGNLRNFSSPASDIFSNVSIQNSGGTETRPRNIALLACIKY